MIFTKKAKFVHVDSDDSFRLIDVDNQKNLIVQKQNEFEIDFLLRCQRYIDEHQLTIKETIMLTENYPDEVDGFKRMRFRYYVKQGNKSVNQSPCEEVLYFQKGQNGTFYGLACVSKAEFYTIKSVDGEFKSLTPCKVEKEAKGELLNTLRKEKLRSLLR